MRCIACNKPMQDYEIAANNPRSGKPEDMCRTCINLSSDYDTAPRIDTIDIDLLDSIPTPNKH